MGFELRKIILSVLMLKTLLVSLFFFILPLKVDANPCSRDPAVCDGNFCINQYGRTVPCDEIYNPYTSAATSHSACEGTVFSAGDGGNISCNYNGATSRIECSLKSFHSLGSYSFDRLPTQDEIQHLFSRKCADDGLCREGLCGS